MAVPLLIVTPGATNSNSYCSLLEAEDYFDNHVYKDTWDVSDAEQQTRALLLATRLLDEHMLWNGDKVVTTQALRFPRSGNLDRDGNDVSWTTIPKALINATAEFASNLLISDRTLEDDTRGYSKMRAGDLELTINQSDRKQVIPESVSSMLSFLGRPKSKQSNKLTRC